MSFSLPPYENYAQKLLNVHTTKPVAAPKLKSNINPYIIYPYNKSDQWIRVFKISHNTKYMWLLLSQLPLFCVNFTGRPSEEAMLVLEDKLLIKEGVSSSCYFSAGSFLAQLEKEQFSSSLCNWLHSALN